MYLPKLLPTHCSRVVIVLYTQRKTGTADKYSFRLNFAAWVVTEAECCSSLLRSRAGGLPISVHFARNVAKYTNKAGWKQNNVLIMKNLVEVRIKKRLNKLGVGWWCGRLENINHRYICMHCHPS